MVSDSASTLFVPQRVRELKPGGDAVPYFSNSSEIFITRNVQAGHTWRVSAPIYSYADPGIGALTEICAAQSEDPRWNDILNTYLDLPKHLEKPIWELAEKITDILRSILNPYSWVRTRSYFRASSVGAV